MSACTCKNKVPFKVDTAKCCKILCNQTDADISVRIQAGETRVFYRNISNQIGTTGMLSIDGNSGFDNLPSGPVNLTFVPQSGPDVNISLAEGEGGTFNFANIVEIKATNPNPVNGDPIVFDYAICRLFDSN
ncbi:hypothetical protein V1503_24315 [Bacillus sp. SCS-151]|uniref:hypothetical protein n=1 Tax=Nanhaiella sioensis TaxID=3115293 RepID=UPI00397A5E01